MRPELTVQTTQDGVHILNIIPHPAFGAKEKSITVTTKELDCIVRWKRDHGVIQKYLPDWPVSKRELLLSGMDQAEWDQYMGKEESDDQA